MDKLDLHGMRHSEVERVVENFVLLNEPPLEIITGNSERMRSIVQKVLKSYQFNYYRKCHTNFGSIIVIGYNIDET